MKVKKPFYWTMSFPTVSAIYRCEMTNDEGNCRTGGFIGDYGDY